MKTLRFCIAALTIFFLAFFEVFSETEVVFSDDFETDKGWAVDPYGTDDATTGMWERANPEGTYYQLDVTPGTGWNDLVTGPLAGYSYGDYDIDDGKTSIRSPDINLPDNISITLTFKYYLAHANNSSSADYLRVKVVDDSGNPHVVFEELGASDTDYPSWEDAYVDISEFNSQTIYLLIEAADESEPSLVEAGIDDVLIEKGAECMPEPTCYRGEFWVWDDVPYGNMHNSNYRAGQVTIGLDQPTQNEVDFEVGEASYFHDRMGIGKVPSPDYNLDVAGDLNVEDWIYCYGFSGTNTIGVFNPSNLNQRSDMDYERIEVRNGSAFRTVIRPHEIDLLEGAASATFLTARDITTPLLNADEVKVNGVLTAKHFTVTLDGFPDYVFSGSHTLKTLSEIEEYINKHGTLPGMPSEKEVKENGVDLGKLNVKLVEKIEELTLLMIALEKKNKALEARIEQIEKIK